MPYGPPAGWRWEITHWSEQAGTNTASHPAALGGVARGLRARGLEKCLPSSHGVQEEATEEAAHLLRPLHLSRCPNSESSNCYLGGGHGSSAQLPLALLSWDGGSGGRPCSAARLSHVLVPLGGRHLGDARAGTAKDGDVQVGANRAQGAGGLSRHWGAARGAMGRSSRAEAMSSDVKWRHLEPGQQGETALRAQGRSC